MVPTSKTRKRGGQSKFVVNPKDGKPIIDFHYQKREGIYYTYFENNEGKNKRKYFHKDFISSLWEFRKFQQKQGKQYIQADKPDYLESLKSKGSISLTAEFAEALEQNNIALSDLIDGISINQVDIPEQIMWSKCRELILTDIVEARKKLSLPIELNGTVQTKSISLEKLGELYFERKRKPLGKEQKYNNKAYWKQFRNIINVNNVRDITLDHINKYQDKIYSIQKKNSYSPTYIRNRYTCIKTILNNGLKYISNSSDINDINLVIAFTKHFELPNKAPVNAKVISKVDYNKMLNTNNKTFKAMVLMAMNCGIRQTGLANIRFKEIDLEKKEFSKPRHKTTIIRTAILWDRTVSALKDMLKGRKYSEDDYLFIDENNKQYNMKKIARWWIKQRREQRVNENVKFEGVRDSVKTIGTKLNINSDILSVILGHELKNIGNNYLERNAEMTKDACLQIEKYYFS